MDIIKDVQKLGAFIANIAERAKQLTGDIHIAAVSALMHASEHGDSSYCTKLVQAMARGLRKNVLISWFEKYGALVWAGKGDEAKFVKSKSKTAVYNIAEAMEHPFYEGTGSEGAEFDAKKIQARLMQMLTSAMKKAEEHHNKKLQSKCRTALDALTA